MKLQEARAECERWFAYLRSQKYKSENLQRIASRRLSGEITLDEARLEMRKIDSDVTVYDGANLEKAVRVLLKHITE